MMQRVLTAAVLVSQLMNAAICCITFVGNAILKEFAIKLHDNCKMPDELLFGLLLVLCTAVVCSGAGVVGTGSVFLSAWTDFNAIIIGFSISVVI